MRSRTARVMTTLMRNGRDRRSGKPVKGQAILERAPLVGTRSADHIRASSRSGCIATGQASTRYCFGDFDFVLVADVPNNESMTAISLAVAAGGAIKSSRTTALMTGAQTVQAMKKVADVAKVYRPAT